MINLFPAIHKAKNTQVENCPVLLHPSTAIDSALSYIGIKKEDVTDCTRKYADGFYEIFLSTDWLSYDIYVDCDSGEVMGCSFEPVALDNDEHYRTPVGF